MADGVLGDAVVRELAPFGCVPFGGKWMVWKHEKTEDGNKKGDDAFDNKKPLPSFEAMRFVEGGEGCGCDEARDGGSDDVSGVEDGNT